VRTIFNVLGPLTNPASAPNQLVGVFASHWVEPLAQVLAQLGSHHVLVVHSHDGMDEISIAAPTQVAELNNGKVTTYTITPEQFHIPRGDVAHIKVKSVQESVEKVRAVLDNKPGPARDIVALNAGAAIYCAGLAPDIGAGVKRAQEVIASGAAKAKLEALVVLSTSFTS
jgi:anthranilate phosphoribosyltransferase